MPQLRIIDGSGDTKIIWDSENEDEVKIAKKAFDELTKKGYKAFAVKKDGEPGEIVKKFDADAEKLILMPQIAGG